MCSVDNVDLIYGLHFRGFLSEPLALSLLVIKSNQYARRIFHKPWTDMITDHYQFKHKIPPISLIIYHQHALESLILAIRVPPKL